MTRFPPFPEHLATATLAWRDGTPVSAACDDVYFSVAGGTAESTHVFIDGNDLPSRFRAGGFRVFTIGETGFGTGLNFLLAAREFLAGAPADATLHFVSVENAPLAHEDLLRAHAHWPELQPLAEELRAVFPQGCSGFHRRTLCSGRIRLTLLLGDADALLPRLSASVDAWFLDGFSPAKNPGIWSDSVFFEVARLCAPGATFSTFTSAGVVKRGLRAAGFKVRRTAGFGTKRDMLRGHFLAGTGNKPACPDRGCVAVIGGGLAGCAAARALAERGWQVTMFERNETLANETSGNLAGAVYPKFSPHETAQNRWYRDSYLFALARLPAVMGEPDGVAWNACGLLQLEAEKKSPTDVYLQRWPAQVVRAVTATEASQLAGITQETGGLWFSGAAWVNPPALCRRLATHENICLRTATTVETLIASDQGWLVNGDHFAVVVIANALAANQFAPTESLPLRRVRGQVTHVAATPASGELRAIVCHEGYVTPMRENLHCIGATFAPRDADPSVRDDDHAENLKELAGACPAIHAALGGNELQIHGGRTGFRTQTPDYLPVIGAVADETRLSAITDESPPPRLPGLYVISALGAKGIAFSLLGAELLAAQINQEPLPVDREVADALDPARFALRALKRKGRRKTE